MRLCIYGLGHTNAVNTLHTLDRCNVFWTENQTLSRVINLDMVLIKVINLTKPLKVGDNIHYHGRWAPNVAASSLSDELFYEQYGQYQRYITERTIVTFTLSEQPFYVQNIQQPIVRKAELAFHTLLFCTLIIELFGMSFLLFRLAITPLIRTLLRYYQHNKPNNSTSEIS